MKRIRILVADDHTIVRQSIIALIESESNFCVVAEADNGEKLVEKYFRFKPAIVITDISMPRVNGLEAVKSIIARDTKAKIIFLSIHNTDDYIYKAFKTGASGLIGKDSLQGELKNAIETVIDGEKYFMGKSDDDIKKIIETYERNDLTDSVSKVEHLSHREIQILKCLSQGLTTDEIVDKLILGKRVVEVTRSSIMAKLGIKTYHNLIRFAVEYYYKKDVQL